MGCLIFHLQSPFTNIFLIFISQLPSRHLGDEKLNIYAHITTFFFFLINCFLAQWKLADGGGSIF